MTEPIEIKQIQNEVFDRQKKAFRVTLAPRQLAELASQITKGLLAGLKETKPGLTERIKQFFVGE